MPSEQWFVVCNFWRQGLAAYLQLAWNLLETKLSGLELIEICQPLSPVLELEVCTTVPGGEHSFSCAFGRETSL